MEVVVLHVRGDEPGQSEVLVERRTVLGREQRAVFIGEPVAFGEQRVAWALDLLAALERSM